MTETDLQRAIMRALRTCGVWVIRTQSSGRSGPRSVATGEPGMPDLYLPGLGHLEVKLPGGKVSEAQHEWHAKADRAGVRVAVVRSVSEAIKVAAAWGSER